MGFSLSSILGGGDSGGVSSVPSTSKSQRELEKATSKFLQDWLKNGLPGFEGQITPEIPGLLREGFDELTAGRDRFSSGIDSAVQDAIEGKRAFEFDPGEATKMFQETFYTPMMAMFRDVAVPAIRESMNVPGSAFSSPLSRGVVDATSRFAGENLVQPFYSLIEGERTAARNESVRAEAGRLPAAAFGAALPAAEFGDIANSIRNLMGIEQQPLSAAYQEYLRTAPEAAIGAAVPLSTQSTIDNIYQPGGSSPLGQIAGMAVGGLAAGYGSSLFTGAISTGTAALPGQYNFRGPLG